jgi:hypothetical protein
MPNDLDILTRLVEGYNRGLLVGTTKQQVFESPLLDVSTNLEDIMETSLRYYRELRVAGETVAALCAFHYIWRAIQGSYSKMPVAVWYKLFQTFNRVIAVGTSFEGVSCRRLLLRLRDDFINSEDSGVSNTGAAILYVTGCSLLKQGEDLIRKAKREDTLDRFYDSLFFSAPCLLASFLCLTEISGIAKEAPLKARVADEKLVRVENSLMHAIYDVNGEEFQNIAKQLASAFKAAGSEANVLLFDVFHNRLLYPECLKKELLKEAGSPVS